MAVHRGVKRRLRVGYGARRAAEGMVWVVRRWHGMR